MRPCLQPSTLLIMACSRIRPLRPPRVALPNLCITGSRSVLGSLPEPFAKVSPLSCSAYWTPWSYRLRIRGIPSSACLDFSASWFRTCLSVLQPLNTVRGGHVLFKVPMSSHSTVSMPLQGDENFGCLRDIADRGPNSTVFAFRAAVLH